MSIDSHAGSVEEGLVELQTTISEFIAPMGSSATSDQQPSIRESVVPGTTRTRTRRRRCDRTSPPLTYIRVCTRVSWTMTTLPRRVVGTRRRVIEMSLSHQQMTRRSSRDHKVRAVAVVAEAVGSMLQRHDSISCSVDVGACVSGLLLGITIRICILHNTAYRMQGQYLYVLQNSTDNTAWCRTRGR